jgi:hypothetical protein
VAVTLTFNSNHLAQVKIYILLWRDPALFTENGSREVQKLLCQLHDNIKVIPIVT